MTDEKEKIKARIYEYELIFQSLPAETAIINSGIVYLYRGSGQTENDSVYVNREYLGSFIYRGKGTFSLYLTKDMGEEVFCGYEPVSNLGLYFLNGYIEHKVINDIYVFNDAAFSITWPDAVGKAYKLN